MFYYLSGKLALVRPDMAVIDCGGVGWKLTITENTYKEIAKAENATLYTYLSVSENALDLYGFHSEQEKQFFELLISVSGVGPKAAVSILSQLTPDALARCILSEDTKSITKANGVGAKIAQRVCLELKDKMKKLNVTVSPSESGGIMDTLEASDTLSDAVEVLITMGYAKNDAEKAVTRCSADNTADIVKQALRILSRNI